MLNSNDILTNNTSEDYQLLTVLLKKGPMDIKLFLKIAIAITKELSDLHQKNIIHQSIHPSIILANLKQEAVKIIESPKSISTDLSYISPELTGRINDPIDFRSDLYSLGIIFYHMLAGKHPFNSDSAMEMVHFHLAQKAHPLHILDNRIPRTISEIVEKLMEKKADHRYQSAYGLKYDLEEYSKRLSDEGQEEDVDEFIIGMYDLPDKLCIPDRLYCREQEKEKLMTAYDRVKEGRLEIVFVAGSPGVGKTMLVNRVSDDMQARGATCASGKFDQYKKNTPYSAFIQAFQQIFMNILSEDDEKIVQWKDRILDRLSGNGQLMIEVFPEIEKIIGLQPAVQTLGPMEAQIRFNTVFIRFIQLFASKDHPLVLFLDDLQWADDASIKLLENLIKDTDRQYILIIGTYRQEEVKESLAMNTFLEVISKESQCTNFITLQPLKISAITPMIAEILKRTPQESEQIAHICHQKTQGNPFFLIQFLLTLKEDGFLWLNREAGMWEWDLDSIIREDATENVVSLMIKKIQKLPQESVEILKTAACMNHSFTVRTLATVTEKTQYTVSEYLQVAVDDGLIIKEQEGYRFLHDRVQQAVYSLVDDDKKCIIHYKIAKLLYENTAASEKETMLFEIVDHYNMAHACIYEEKEQQLIARLNLQTGKKAKASSAYERALEYFKSGIHLLGADKWEEQYEITLDLHIQAIEAAYVCTRFRLMEKTADEILDHVKNILDEARVYEVLIAAHTVQNNLKKALETGRYILKRLGIRIPKNPTLAHIFWLYIRIQHALRGKEMEELLNIPSMTNEKYITAMSILNTISMASYSSSYYTTIIIGFYVTLLSLKHGITDVTIIAYSGHGFICSSLLNKAQLGYTFGQLALKLQEKMNVKKYECKTRLMFNMIIRHGVDPLRKTLEDFPHTYESGFASGDLISAGHCIMQYFVYSYFSGRELAVIEKEWHEHRGAMLKTKHETSIRLCEIYLQTILNFKGETEDPCRLAGRYFDESTMLPVYKESNDRTVVFNIYFHRMIQYYFFGETHKALENAPRVWEYLDGVLGTYCTPLVHFYTTLVAAASMDAFKGIQKHVYRQKINKSIKVMERFSRSAPENNLHKLYLMKAERARIYEDFKEAATYYDLAVEHAGKNRFIQEEAMANEAAGRFYHAMGRTKIAAIYFKNACSCYQKWGAAAKVKDLENKYAEMLSKDNEKGYGTNEHNSGNAAYNALSNIDLHAIIKASQAISGEIQLDELLKLLIKTVLQNSGARKAVFLINEEGNLSVAAKGHADAEIQLVQSSLLDKDGELPEKLIHYVVRTGEEVILASPASILCMPVIVKGKIIGILYLENELIQGAFNRERMYILQMLASQIAISLENAKLYKQMEGIIEKRTKELREKNKELIDTNKKLADASEAKTNFVANISHEVRTPLQGIIGMVSLLEKSGLQENRYVEMIQSSAQTLLEIINDLLDISRIEANRMVMQYKEFNLRLLLEELTQVLEYDAKAKGIRFYCMIHPEVPECLQGDPLRIQQVLNNIITNAIKFTHDGSVTLEVNLKSIQANTAVIQFVIKDTGIGIPPDKLDCIFDSFIQVDARISKKYGGTGLGLAIVKKLVNMMQGDIQVASTEGLGSMFVCTLPFNIADNIKVLEVIEEREIPQRVNRDLKRLKVAAAEDNSINQIYIKHLLEYYNCDVTITDNGNELLQLMQDNEYDCILMDKNMPEKDGIEVTRIIRKNEAGTGRHIPIIALTASAIVGDREKLLAEGMDYYLSKPIREKELLNILSEISSSKEKKQDMGAECLPEYLIEGVKRGDGATAAPGFGEAEAPSPGFATDERSSIPMSDFRTTNALSAVTSISSSSGDSFIDMEIFKEEAELFGKDVIMDIINEFLKTYKTQIEQIETDLKNKDCMKLERSAHKLAGSIANFYADEIYTMVKTVEKNAHNGNIEEAAAMYAKLTTYIDPFIQELEKIKDSLHN